ncbi:MAG TPA: hypothetical protein DCS93_30910 [Microscillaceae bacterium]|nr:hypothetical protein [Microscillaceae bacterium]
MGYAESLEFVLMYYKNSEGVEYPIIGLKTSNNELSMGVPMVSYLPQDIKGWIKQMGIKNLKREAVGVATIPWKTLKQLGIYPEKN